MNMDGRVFGSGFSNWRGGSSRGSDDYDHEQYMYDQYDYGQGAGNYGNYSYGYADSRNFGPGDGGYGKMRRARGGRGFRRRQDVGGWDGGHEKPPSLLSHRVYPKGGWFQPQRGPQDFTQRFGGGRRSNQQRNRKRPQRDGQKKRRRSETEVDEPNFKMGKTETLGEDTSEDEEEQEEDTKDVGDLDTASDKAAEGECKVLSIEEELAQLKEKLQGSGSADKTEETEDNPETEGQSSALSIEEELSQMRMRLQNQQASNEIQLKRGYFEMSGVKITARRISFVCSVCKFRSFYSDEMAAHLESKFHKDVIKFLSSRLSKRTMSFLLEYLNAKRKSVEKTVSKIKNHSAAVCQLYKEGDLTRDIEMEHFMKKVEAAYCSACNLYIPMQHSLIQKHLKTRDHNYNRKRMIDVSRKSSLTVARSILNHKPVLQKMERYLKGENPFTDEADDEDLEDPGAMEAAEGDPTSEGPGEKEGAEPAASGEPSSENQVERGEQEENEKNEEQEEPKEPEETRMKSDEGDGAQEMEGAEEEKEKDEEKAQQQQQQEAEEKDEGKAQQQQEEKKEQVEGVL